MNPISRLSRLHRRALRMTHYRKVRAELERLTESDLADIGLRRYQLATVARHMAFH